MGLEFTWIDAVMIILMFTVFGLISGKNEYEKKLETVQSFVSVTDSH